jgi:beta-lactamase regulating signal transducer with metallopeptidase domain
MIAAWMLQSLVVGTLAALGALACEWAFRALRWPTRWAWAAALLLLAALTALAPLRTPAMRLRVPVSEIVVAPAALAPRAPDDGFMLRVQALRARLAAPVPMLAHVLGGPRMLALAPWLLAAWATLSAALLAMSLVVAWRLAQARRAWPLVDLHGERVRLAPSAGPAVIGLTAAGIVVPRWLLGRSADEQRVVLAHEREHLRARDPLLLALGSLVTIALPWHPLAWWLQSRLRLAVELDCDRRVLGAGIAPRTYGALLLDVAGRGTGLPLGLPLLGVPTLATRTSHLERRLVAMTSPRARFPRARIALAAAVSLVAVLAACESRLPTSAELEGMKVADMEARVALGADTSVIYVIDGRPATAADARALKAERIGSISIDKGEGATKRVVRIMKASDSSVLASSLVPTPASSPVNSRMKQPGSPEARFDGIVIIDGVRASETALSRLAPGALASVEVIKGARAQALYPDDPAAARGVIRVTTLRATVKE